MSEKSIIRVSKNKNNPYVMMNKEFLSDSKLSWRAKGMQSYLLSKPDNWQVNPNDLIKKSKDGRDAVYAILNELISAGYIERNTIRNSKGHFLYIEYIVYEIAVDTTVSPFTEFPYTGEPNMDEPHTEEPNTGKPHISKDLDFKDIDLTNNNSSNNKPNKKPNKKPINPSIKITKDDDMMDGLNLIYDKCNINLYPTKIQTFIKNALTDMYLTDNFSKTSNIPIDIVREKLEQAEIYHFDTAINNYKNAKTRSEQQGTTITASMKYFEKCLWNAIKDSELNDSGIFDDIEDE